MKDDNLLKPKPWTISQGVIAANANDVRKAAAINELLGEHVAVLPQREGDPVLPFAIGLFEVMRAWVDPDLPVIRFRRAVAAYARSKSYLLACAQPDAMRHDIDGKPVEAVTPDARLAAQLRVTEIRRQRKLHAGESMEPVCGVEGKTG